MLSLAYKHHSPCTYSAIAHHAVNYSNKSSPVTHPIPKLKPNSISEKTISKIEKYRTARFPEGMDFGWDLNNLDSNNIFSHARDLDNGNECYRDMAQYLFCIAAEKGNLKALRALGVQIVENAPYLPHEGTSFIKEAADLGEVGAKLVLGGYYLSGNHVEQDIDRGVNYYEQAMGLGYSKISGTVQHIKTHILTDPDPKQALERWISKLNGSKLSRE